MRTNIQLGIIGGILILSGCNQADSNDFAAPPEDLPVIEADDTSTKVVPPNFDEEEDGTYFYIAAIPEEDQKKGRAAGDVLAFRYLGKNQKDEIVLATVDQQSKKILYKNYCKNPCRIIRSDVGAPVGYNSQSVIGAAFEDAIAGRLEESSSVKTPAIVTKIESKFPKFVSSVPKAFFGRWDEIIADKCESREARFYFGAQEFSNFEVEWEVTKVKLYSPTEMDMSTTTYDEQGNQFDETWEFKLTDEGRTLKGRKPDTSFFKKCP